MITRKIKNKNQRREGEEEKLVDGLSSTGKERAKVVVLGVGV